ncbi:MAG: PstS family phosphate ABC transporter substrate-binding protein [Desulfobulbaceae bacterium]|nr:PstS family phosphate ABC transporter substrate-binding protein [Desulfobulbaceae bacterium]
MSRKTVAILTIFAIVCWHTLAQAQDAIRYNGSSTILKAVMYDAAKIFKEEKGVVFDLKGKSTGFGIKKLLAGECDVAGGGRPLSTEEQGKGLVETKAFLDAYAFIVNNSNPVNSITSEQLTGILKGQIVKWDDLNGPAGKKIVILSPPEKSAHYKNTKKIIGFDALPANSMMVDMTPNVLKKVQSFPVAIGWLSAANVNGNKDVKLLQVIHNAEEVAINQSNVLSGKYPYQQTMYFYTKGEPTGSVKEFIDFMKGPKGQTIITSAGFFLAE